MMLRGLFNGVEPKNIRKRKAFEKVLATLNEKREAIEKELDAVECGEKLKHLECKLEVNDQRREKLRVLIANLESGSAL